ncbi:hypothetical protein [Clostridium brassicae]|uniref:Uncharacterized protein n=1 Tax=Clostridium brassicae TaxID=2999072 RepID=A0ABT4D689_9CLOT|nr:hypothetical protein [Clostridium brassicae]MCY6957821.1 hypothetical protein [Clostridium brassicae]
MKVKVITSTDNKNLNIEFTKILFDIALQNVKERRFHNGKDNECLQRNFK